MVDYNNIKLCKKCKVNPALYGLSLCVECKKEKTHYDKDYFKQHATEKTASAVKTKKDLLTWYRTLKNGKQCLVCGGGPFHFCQLDYDHIASRGKKFMDVSKMVRLGYAKERIEQEIALCQLICKCCHALRTWQRIHNINVEQGMF